MNRYIFPAVFEPGEHKGYCVSFPDLPGCITEGDTLEEALHMAKEALELHLYGMEEDGDPIPESTPPQEIEIPTGGFVTIVEAWMDLVRDEMANKAVKKTLTIPKWLNDLAEKNKINFSHVLQVALKHRLGIGNLVDKKYGIVQSPQTSIVHKSGQRIAASACGTRSFRIGIERANTAGEVLLKKATGKVSRKTSSKKASTSGGRKK